MSFLSTLGKIGEVVAGPITSIANSIIGSHSAAKQNKQMMDFQQHMADQQYARQRELTHDLPSLQKQGLVDAGMSPSAIGNYSGAAASIASVPSSPSQQPVYHDLDSNAFVQSLLIPSQIKEAKANADLAKSNADMAALKVNEEKDRQDAFRSATTRKFYIDADTGVAHYTTDPDFQSWADSYSKTHSSLPDLQVIPGRLSEAAVNASKVFSDLSTAIARNNADTITSQFTKTLTDLKLKDHNVMSALYQLDAKQFDVLSKQIEKIGSDIDVNKTIQDLNNAKSAEARQSILESVARTALLGAQEKLIKNQSEQIKNINLGSIFDSFMNGKSFADKLAALGKLIIVALFGSNGGQLGAVGSVLK